MNARDVDLRLVRDRPVRVGVVGCGVVADYGHIPAIHRAPEAQLVGFADPDRARREAQAAKYGLPCFASFAEMAGAVEMDAVTIATQPDVKLEMIRIAAARGLHAFCEKPLTDTEAQAEELVRLMDAAGLFVGVAFVYRGKAVVRRMRELVDEGAIGRLRVLLIENLWDYHGLRDEALRGDRRRRALRNLGTLDCGVHDLDLARYLSRGEFESVQALGDTIEKENVYPDHLMIQARMSSGVLVSIEESAVWGHTAPERPIYQQSYRMIGEEGAMAAEMGDWSQEAHGARLRVDCSRGQWTETVPTEKAWDETYRQFFAVIAGQDVPDRFIADGHDALANMRVARRVIAAAAKG